MKKQIAIILSSLIAASTASSLMAQSHSLSTDKRITDELMAAAIGEEIRNNCDKIKARRTVVFRKAMALKSYALSKGHSEKEIEQFLKSDTERARIFALRDQYLDANGVKKGQAESYCRLGEEEIAKDSFLGSLMKSH